MTRRACGLFDSFFPSPLINTVLVLAMDGSVPHVSSSAIFPYALSPRLPDNYGFACLDRGEDTTGALMLIEDVLDLFFCHRAQSPLFQDDLSLPCDHLAFPNGLDNILPYDPAFVLPSVARFSLLCACLSARGATVL